MTSFMDMPQQLAAEIDAHILAAADLTCLPDVDTIWTAGEPAAPTGQCTVVWVWIAELYNIENGRALGDERGCVIRPGVTLKVRVDVCYEETEQGATATQHAEAADCLHGLMRAIWCGLAAAWAAGTLLDLDCRASSVGPFLVDQRQGGIVSATLDVNAEADCEDIPS